MSSATEDHPSTVGVAGLIRARWGECSPAERKVARALLAAYPHAGLETVATLADRAGVSPPTVLRLANRLGFTGFPELQRALRQELAERDVSPLVSYSAGRTGTPDGVLERAGAMLPGVLTKTLADLPPAEFEAAVRLLADPQLTVTVTGGRFSRLFAEYLLLHLMQIRGRARLLPAAAVERGNLLADVGRRDLFVIFDFRRYEDLSLALAREVTAAGAKVVLVTDRWLSPVAGVAEAVLACPVDSPTTYDSFVPTLAVLETVIGGVIDRLGPAAGERLARIEEVSRRFGLL